MLALVFSNCSKTAPIGVPLSSIRAKVEHPFRVIKRQFGHMKVRYRGLAKNTAQLNTLSSLSKLCMARRRLLQGLQACVGLQSAKRSPTDRKRSAQGPQLHWIGLLLDAKFHVVAIEPLSPGAARVLNTIPRRWVKLSTVADSRTSNPPWVNIGSAGWVNTQSAPTSRQPRNRQRMPESDINGECIRIAVKSRSRIQVNSSLFRLLSLCWRLYDLG